MSWLQSRTEKAINTWLQGSQYRLREVNVVENGITVMIAGEGSPPSIAELRAKLPAKAIGTELMELQMLPIEIKQIELPDTE